MVIPALSRSAVVMIIGHSHYVVLYSWYVLIVSSNSPSEIYLFPCLYFQKSPTLHRTVITIDDEEMDDDARLRSKFEHVRTNRVDAG